jgi:hypothetical protein
LQKGGRFARAGLAQDQQELAGVVKDRFDLCARRQYLAGLVRRSQDHVPGMIDRIGPGFKAQIEQSGLVDGVL